MDLSPADVETAFGPELEWLHLTGYSLFGPYGLELLEAAGRVAEVRGAVFSVDPSSIGVIRRFGAAELLSAMKGAGVGVLLPNAEEARELAGTDDASVAASSLTESAPIILVKDGPMGAAYAGSGTSGRVAVDRITPRDPTGAGDAFNAGAIASLLAGRPLEEACGRGCSTARLALGKFGGR
jgi:sugar/nucleoside kinase (ribokinase family)